MTASTQRLEFNGGFFFVKMYLIGLFFFSFLFANQADEIFDY